MGNGFRRIKSLGSPTQWDIADYVRYRDALTTPLKKDLAAMVSDERFQLGAPGTFWHAQMTSFCVEGAEMRIEFLSDSADRRFRFEYEGLMQMQTDFDVHRFRPSLTVQELVRTGRAYRHCMATLGGRCVTVVARDMRFSEFRVQ